MVGARNAKDIADSEEVYSRIIAYVNHFEPLWLTMEELAELTNAVFTVQFKSLVRKAVLCHLNAAYIVRSIHVIRRASTREYEPDGVRFSKDQRVMFLPWWKSDSALMAQVRERGVMPGGTGEMEPYPEKFNGWWQKPALAPSVALGRF